MHTARTDKTDWSPEQTDRLRRIQARILEAGTTTVPGYYGPLGGPRRRLDHDAFEAWCTLEVLRLDAEGETR